MDALLVRPAPAHGRWTIRAARTPGAGEESPLTPSVPQIDGSCCRSRGECTAALLSGQVDWIENPAPDAAAPNSASPMRNENACMASAIQPHEVA